MDKDLSYSTDCKDKDQRNRLPTPPPKNKDQSHRMLPHGPVSTQVTRNRQHTPSPMDKDLGPSTDKVRCRRYHGNPLPSVPPFPQPACTHSVPQSRTRLRSQKQCVGGGETPPSRAQAMHARLGSARSPGPRPIVRPRASSPHPPAPGPLPPPPRPATTLTFSARAVKGGLPDITSARRHLLQLS